MRPEGQGDVCKFTEQEATRVLGSWCFHGKKYQPASFFLSNKSPQNVEVCNKNSCYFTVSMGQYLGLAWVGSLLWDSHTTEGALQSPQISSGEGSASQLPAVGVGRSQGLTAGTKGLPSSLSGLQSASATCSRASPKGSSQYGGWLPVEGTSKNEGAGWKPRSFT